ncbi:MAG: FlgO family outer membrane protein [bacterium]
MKLLSQLSFEDTMNIVKKYIWIALFIITVLPGCASISLQGKGKTSDNFRYFDSMIEQITEEFSIVSSNNFSPDKRLLITTFVDLNNLKKSSAFGRLLAERLITSLSNLGFKVLEIRGGPNLFIIENEGEMVLTRKNEQIPPEINANAIIYGTYLVSEKEILVTARLALAYNFQVIKSWSGSIPRSLCMDNLLGDRLFDVDVYERIPMREAYK